MSKLLQVIVLLGVFLGLGTSCASASNVITFVPQTIELHPNSSQDVQIKIDSVSKGLIGFEITVYVSDPEIAEITAVSFPKWGMWPRNSTIPSGSVSIKTIDLSNKALSGDTNVSLGNITLTGKKDGITNLSIQPIDIEDYSNNRIKPIVIVGKVHVSDNESSTESSKKSPNFDMITEIACLFAVFVWKKVKRN